MSLCRSIGVFALLAASGPMIGCDQGCGTAGPSQQPAIGKQAVDGMRKGMEQADPSKMRPEDAEGMKTMKEKMKDMPDTPISPGGSAPKTPGN